jgi:hypothetical protein
MILLPVRLRPVYLAAPKNFVVRFHAEPARSPDLAPEAIVLVACVRDEMIRIAQFLDHYRRIGVDHFVIVDNASEDGTAEFLEQQSDVSLYRTTQSFAAAAAAGPGSKRFWNATLRIAGASWRTPTNCLFIPDIRTAA